MCKGPEAGTSMGHWRHGNQTSMARAQKARHKESYSQITQTCTSCLGTFFSHLRAMEEPRKVLHKAGHDLVWTARNRIC